MEVRGSHYYFGSSNVKQKIIVRFSAWVVAPLSAFMRKSKNAEKLVNGFFIPDTWRPKKKSINKWTNNGLPHGIFFISQTWLSVLNDSSSPFATTSSKRLCEAGATALKWNSFSTFALFLFLVLSDSSGSSTYQTFSTRFRQIWMFSDCLYFRKLPCFESWSPLSFHAILKKYKNHSTVSASLCLH